jgi:hypothetical protein
MRDVFAFETLSSHKCESTCPIDHNSAKFAIDHHEISQKE